jgi:hypothetical protein
MDGSAKDTGVQVTTWTRNADLEVGESTKTVGYGWCTGVEPVVIRLYILCQFLTINRGNQKFTYDANAINAIKPPILAFLHFTLDKFIKALTPALLHSFEAELQIDRQFKSEFLVRFQNVNPSKDRPFVVGGSAADQTACGFVDY